MTEVFKTIGDTLTFLYNSIINILPPFLQKFIAFFVIAIVIVIYGFIVWKFYKSISKKDILGLDLNKYNKTKHPFVTKIVAGTLYFVEYILVSPLIIFLWFALLTILLVAVTEAIPAGTVLIISGLIIASVRIISYSNKDLAQDIAKIVPLTLLAMSFLSPQFFSVERILGTFAQIPGLFGEIGIYLVFIIFLEIILRLFDFIFSLFQMTSPIKKEEEEE
jgi:hypothetical protein